MARTRKIAAAIAYLPNDATGAVAGKPHMLTTCRGECRLTDDELSALVFSGQQAHQQSKWDQIDRSQHAAIEAEAVKLAEDAKKKEKP